MHTRSFLLGALTATLAACGNAEPTNVARAGQGVLRVQLTDAPFPFDSVKSVDVFVVRVDARLVESDSAEAARGAGDDSSSAGAWITIARPNRRYDLLTLRGGTVADIGQDTLPAGAYRGFRLIIDPSLSGVTLVNGMQLTGSSSPSVTFPSAARTGIKVVLTKPIEVGKDSSSTVLIDFDLEKSFVMRGNSITRNGLLFKPVVTASPR